MINKIVQLFIGALEALTGFFGFITSDHAYIHQAKAFTAIIPAGSISAAYHICFKTPTVASGKYIHYRPLGITSSADYVDIKLYEGETYTGGDAITPINRNRVASATASTMQAFVKGATVTPAGVLLYNAGVGSTGGPQNKAGAGGGADEELVLKQNTIYCLTLTPAGATTVTASVFWYEEDEGTV